MTLMNKALTIAGSDTSGGAYEGRMIKLMRSWAFMVCLP